MSRTIVHTSPWLSWISGSSAIALEIVISAGCARESLLNLIRRKVDLTVDEDYN